MKIKRFDEGTSQYPEDDDSTPNDESLNKLVEKIIDTVASNLFSIKLEADDIEESDPEIISRISNMIKMWHDKNR